MLFIIYYLLLFIIYDFDNYINIIIYQDLLKIFYQIVNGLNVLHRNNYVHRDIKPLNILIYKGGIIKICDFGISKKSSEKTTSIHFGTLFYFIYLFFIVFCFIYFLLLFIIFYFIC
jgi:serine/threonine protein kinase